MEVHNIPCQLDVQGFSCVAASDENVHCTPEDRQFQASPLVLLYKYSSAFNSFTGKSYVAKTPKDTNHRAVSTTTKHHCRMSTTQSLAVSTLLFGYAILEERRTIKASTLSFMSEDRSDFLFDDDVPAASSASMPLICNAFWSTYIFTAYHIIIRYQPLMVVRVLHDVRLI